MRFRLSLKVLFVVAALAMLSGVCLELRRIRELSAERQQRLAELENLPFVSLEKRSGPAEFVIPISSELLRLRNEVNRLAARKRELAAVQAENDRLRAQLAARGTNNSSGPSLPPGYIRKSQARLVGYSRPEDTIQSFLWSVQNQDAKSLSQAFVPAEPGKFSPIQDAESFFSRTHEIFGLRVVGQVPHDPEADGNIVEVQVELASGVPPSVIGLKQIAGQWKILWVPF